jgi:hypothetical protein
MIPAFTSVGCTLANLDGCILCAVATESLHNPCTECNTWGWQRITTLVLSFMAVLLYDVTHVEGLHICADSALNSAVCVLVAALCTWLSNGGVTVLQPLYVLTHDYLGTRQCCLNMSSDLPAHVGCGLALS